MGPALQGPLQYCGRTGASAPTEAQQEVQWAGDRKGRPYGSVTRSAVGRADVGIGPYGKNLGRTKGKSKRILEYPLAFDRSEELEVFDDVNDFSTDALLSLQGGGADMSGRLENVPVAHF